MGHHLVAIDSMATGLPHFHFGPNAPVVYAAGRIPRKNGDFMGIS